MRIMGCGDSDPVAGQKISRMGVWWPAPKQHTILLPIHIRHRATGGRDQYFLPVIERLALVRCIKKRLMFARQIAPAGRTPTPDFCRHALFPRIPVQNEYLVPTADNQFTDRQTWHGVILNHIQNTIPSHAVMHAESGFLHYRFSTPRKSRRETAAKLPDSDAAKTEDRIQKTGNRSASKQRRQKPAVSNRFHREHLTASESGSWRQCRKPQIVES